MPLFKELPPSRQIHTTLPMVNKIRTPTITDLQAEKVSLPIYIDRQCGFNIKWWIVNYPSIRPLNHPSSKKSFTKSFTKNSITTRRNQQTTLVMTISTNTNAPSPRNIDLLPLL
jgi:hypothetical protein